MVQKTKKRILYTFAVLFGVISTFFVAGKDDEMSTTVVDEEVDAFFINKVRADSPHGDSSGDFDWGSDSADADGYDSGGDADSSDGVADEYS